MSLAYEQYRSLKLARELMFSILRGDRKNLRERASRAVKHFPPLREDGTPLFSYDGFTASSNPSSDPDRPNWISVEDLIRNRVLGSCTTTPWFWECDCDKNHIHDFSELQCKSCGVLKCDAPDARLAEVMLLLIEDSGVSRVGIEARYD